MINRISHIGLVVRDIEKTSKLYAKLFGVQPTEVMDAPELGYKAVMIPVGNSYIELMESTDPKSELGQFLEKSGEGLYHICVVTDDINAEIKSLRDGGVDLMETPPIASMPFKRGFLPRKSTHGARIEIVTEDVVHYLFEKMSSGEPPREK